MSACARRAAKLIIIIIARHTKTLIATPRVASGLEASWRLFAELPAAAHAMLYGVLTTTHASAKVDSGTLDKPST